MAQELVALVGPERAGPLMQDIAHALAGHGRMARTCIATDLLAVPWISEITLLVCLVTPCGSEQMDAMPRLRAIVSPLLGHEWIDIPEATRRGIPVVNGEVAENRESMAEATIMLLLVLLYQLRETEAQLRVLLKAVAPYRRMLKGRTVGIIGSGGIAREIILRMVPWQADVQVFTRAQSPDLPGVRLVGLHELLATSDVVILMTSLDASRRHLLNAEQLQHLKPGALLINTARGGLIEENALLEALKSGRIAAAALDVFEVEPLPADHPLRELPNVILTPHAVGHTVQAEAAVPRQAVGNILQLLGGALPDSCKNRTVERVWFERQAGQIKEPMC